MEHKQTPWKIGAMESGMVAIDSSDDKEVTGFIDPEDARRIVACVNACEGIPIDVLEDDCFNKMREDRDMLMKQRDELLAALKSAVATSICLNPEHNYCAEWRSEINKMREAIASAKGGAK